MWIRLPVLLVVFATGCELSGAALIGGETAEMPGMYNDEDYDLAGFCVGIVEKDKVIDGQSVQPGDCLIALGSSGPHSNGYSLVRKVLEHSKTPLDFILDGQPLIKSLLAPTHIYVKSLLSVLDSIDIRSLCHITGGGLPENLPRVLPDNTTAVIDRGSWQWPSVFQWLQTSGNIEQHEMYRTFNCGVGMVMCVPESQAKNCLDKMTSLGETAWIIGRIEASEGSPNVKFI